MRILKRKALKLATRKVNFKGVRLMKRAAHSGRRSSPSSSSYLMRGAPFANSFAQSKKIAQSLQRGFENYQFWKNASRATAVVSLGTFGLEYKRHRRSRKKKKTRRY